MHIDTSFLALDNWSLPWTHIIAKLVIYSIACHFLIFPAVRGLKNLFNDMDR